MSKSVLLENHISGVVAPAGRISRNNNLYLPSELMRGDGKRIPFFSDHEDFEMQEGIPTGAFTQALPRGYVTLHWNAEEQRLEFDGECTDPGLVRSIKAGERPFVSLAAQPKSYDIYHGHTVPLGLDFFSLSAVQHPGIPETTLNMERIAAEAWIKNNRKTPAPLCLVEGMLTSPPDQIARRQKILFGQPQIPDGIMSSYSSQNADLRKQQTLNKLSAHEEEDQQKTGGIIMPAVSEPMSDDAKKMLSNMKKQYEDPKKAKSVFYSTLAKIGKKDTDSLSKEECAEFMEMFARENTTANISTSTAGTASGVDTWQGPMPDDRAIAQQMIQGASSTGYKSSPALGPADQTERQPSTLGMIEPSTLGMVDQKPGVPTALQKDDGEVLGVKYGIADGSKKPHVEYFVVKKSLEPDAEN